MYPRNAVAPERIAVGQVVLIADGTVQVADVIITIRGQGGAEGAGGGTIEYGADGTVYYTPTQAETNYTSFVVIASKADCFSVSVTVITEIESGLLLNTTVAAVNSQTNFNLTDGAPDNAVYGNQVAVFTAADNPLQKGWANINASLSTNNNIALETPPQFTVEAGDLISIVLLTGSSVGLLLDSEGNIFVGGVQSNPFTGSTKPYDTTV